LFARDLFGSFHFFPDHAFSGSGGIVCLRSGWRQSKAVALTDIGSSLQNGQASGSASANSSPGDLKSKIEALIAGQVSGGELPSDQATELQGVFKATFADGSSGPPSVDGAHHGHHGGHGGPPPTDNSSTTDSTNTASSADDVLQQFLQSLQNSLSASSSSSYSATGSSGPGNRDSSSLSALLINYQT
jgi:hypothetical protein